MLVLGRIARAEVAKPLGSKAGRCGYLFGIYRIVASIAVFYLHHIGY